MNRAPRLRIALWLLLLAGAVIVVARARYTTDMSAFLPRNATSSQQLLVDQLRDGPLSRLMLIAVEGSDSANRTRLSAALAQRLRASPLFSMVNNGEAPDAERDRKFIFDHRYLLSPTVTADRFAGAGLADAIQDSVDALASPAGLLLKSILPSDPTGETLQILEQLDRSAQPRRENGVWVSPTGGRALLIAQTRAAGSDTDAQKKAIDAVRGAFAELQPAPTGTASAAARLILSGPGVFAVTARETIQSEAMRLSLLSSLAIAALLFSVYRSLTALMLGLVPVACGALAGIAAVSLGFGTVHGLTLGFGITLIGESVDYSIYLFIQSRRARMRGETGADRWTLELWPTVRLGMFTSIVGFASLLPSGFPGLAQLGLYSIAGLLAAGLVTRYVLPSLLPQQFVVRDLAPLGRAAMNWLPRQHTARAIPWVVLAMATVIVFAHRHALWNVELSALSPVSAGDQALDAELRSELGAAEVGDLVVVSGDTLDEVLRSAERGGTVLDGLVAAGAIGGYDSPARFLPSLTTQSQRRGSLPEPEVLRRRTQAALADSPLRPAKLEPFFKDVEAARKAALITPGDLANTSFATAFDALIIHQGSAWHALLPLHAVPGRNAGSIDLAQVRAQFGKNSAASATVLDLKQESDALYSAYLTEALRLSLAGFAAIALLLLAALRSVRALVQVLAPLIISVLTVTAGLCLMGQQLTILHLIGMLLIVAVGSNYALFFRKMDSHLTLASILIANTTTVLAFGILAFSKVPVLAALGETVAPGAWLALVFSALLSNRMASQD